MGDLSGFFARPWPFQAPVFVAFIEKAETISFIVDGLDPVRTFPAEEEQGIAVRIKLETMLDDIDQTIQLFPHIRVPGAYINLFYPGEVA